MLDRPAARASASASATPVIARLDDICPRIMERAAALDEDGAFPGEDIADLAGIGLLEHAFDTPEHRGIAIGAPDELRAVLRALGHANLALGRLVEGHFNAAALIARYGTPAQCMRAAEAARGGQLFGVWNTEGPDRVRLVPESGGAEAGGLVLAGRKTFASGAGFLDCPLITALTPAEEVVMVLPRLHGRGRSDLSEWRAHGMRASATGSHDFTGIAVGPGDILGSAGDYHRQPAFSGGAWRFTAVQLGAIERLLDELRAHLGRTGRAGDPHQLARVGQAAIAAETAALWVEKASRLAEAGDAPAEPTIAYVDLARCAVERCGLDVLELVQRSIGLSAFMRTHPAERIARDLSTYLRQPAPDRALCAGAGFVLGSDRPTGTVWR